MAFSTLRASCWVSFCLLERFWSTYAGYVDPSRRLPWVDYDTLLHAWQGGFGGLSPAEGYRQYVEAGLAGGMPPPFDKAIDGWILSSTIFADRVRELMNPANQREEASPKGSHPMQSAPTNNLHGAES